MTRILSFLLLFLSLSISTLLLPLSQVSAATPNASLVLSKDKKFATVAFSNLKGVSKVNYTLTYKTNNRTTGVEGSIRTLGRTSKSSRRQILGTCSTRRCVYHANPNNLVLDATFYLTTGGTTKVTKQL